MVITRKYSKQEYNINRKLINNNFKFITKMYKMYFPKKNLKNNNFRFKFNIEQFIDTLTMFNDPYNKLFSSTSSFNKL